MTADIHVGDVGTELVVAFVDEAGTAINIAAATTLTITLKKPGAAGALLVRTAVVDTTGLDGLARYNTVAGDLSVAGDWQVQGFAVVAGNEWHTAKTTFLVARNLA